MTETTDNAVPETTVINTLPSETIDDKVENRSKEENDTTSTPTENIINAEEITVKANQQESEPQSRPRATENPGEIEKPLIKNITESKQSTSSGPKSDEPADGTDLSQKKPVSSSGDGRRGDTPQPVQKEEVNDNSQGDTNDGFRSPEVQNAIVERSPGGRYVRFMEKLGSGASKDVYRAYDTQEGIEVAWNVVNLAGVPKTERNRIVNEVRLLERLHHHNIISFHGSWVNRERQEVNFVTEILSSGTLKSFIKKVQVIRWKIAKRWAVQILNGLDYLHSQEPPVIHRDLKCENIFINGTSGDLRIGDLGLSTVHHRNGRALSVLGTPEFMAPDMYEESSYDEKVDVYAFGMCLLEIFTKEIPYSECKNPAQIYKKVSSGEPPEVLGRLQSKHARDFVVLCLGYKDRQGKYVRPSVAELLQHPFLDKRSNDDDEVVVDPPLREDAIIESSAESSSMDAPKRMQSNKSSPISVQPLLTAVRNTIASNNSFDDNDGDQFEEMQESEITMRKVKVLMGRGQELEESVDQTNLKTNNQSNLAPVPAKEESKSTESSTLEKKHPKHPAALSRPKYVVNEDKAKEVTSEFNQSAQHHSIRNGAPVHDQGLRSAPRPIQSNVPRGFVSHQNNSNDQTSSMESQARHYLVAAAVVENENPSIRPYADDILKLIVALPVDGKTQNVQFDFHLVEDDPFQVAKEMVDELGIPQAAVVEISETISGLARTARMKQDRHAVWMQQSTQNQQVQIMEHLTPLNSVQETVHNNIKQDYVQHPQQPVPPVQRHAHQQVHLGSLVNGNSQEWLQYQQHGTLHPLHAQHNQNPSKQVSVISHEAYAPRGDVRQRALQPDQLSGNSVPIPQDYIYFPQETVATTHQLRTQQSVASSSQDQTSFQRNPVLENYATDGNSHEGQPYRQVDNISHGNQVGTLLSYQEQGSYPQATQEQIRFRHPSVSHVNQAPSKAIFQDHLQYQYQPKPTEVSRVNYGHGFAAVNGMQSNVNHADRTDQLVGQSLPQEHIFLRGKNDSVNGALSQHVPSSNHPTQIPPARPTAEGMIYPPTTSNSYVSDQMATNQAPDKPNTNTPHEILYSQQTSASFVNSKVTSENPNHQIQGNPNQPLPQNVLYTSHHSPVPSSLPTYDDTSTITYATGSFKGPNPGTHALIQGMHHNQNAHGSNQIVLPADTMSENSTDLNRRHAARPSDDGCSVLTSEATFSMQSQFVQGGTLGGSPASTQQKSFIERTASLSDDYGSEDDNNEDEELRKLEEEFQRNLQRAKKVFISRMDNLQKSQVERDVQHQKTLERHQKERADYEKRLAQEEEQQNRRIEQLQREWERKRESFAQGRRNTTTAVKNGLQRSTSDKEKSGEAAGDAIPSSSSSTDNLS